MRWRLNWLSRWPHFIGLLLSTTTTPARASPQAALIAQALQLEMPSTGVSASVMEKTKQVKPQGGMWRAPARARGQRASGKPRGCLGCEAR